MKVILKTALFAFASASILSAGSLPPAVQAKFIKILAASANTASVACSDSAIQQELGKLGVGIDAGSKVSWASSEGEVKALQKAKKLVICGELGWLASGGSVAVLEEGGKPAIYLHMGHISASGITLSDAILKIGKKTN